MPDEKDINSDEPMHNTDVRQNDITELHFGERDVQRIGSFGKFKNLQRLWLNGNKLRRINCLHENFRLTELYLQHNLLVDITGSLRHLTELQVLMLQGNQLKHLTDVIHELGRMQRLQVLNLFGNPLAQDYDYRNYVIHNIKSLQRLDRREILKKERVIAQKRYGDECYERLKETLAFGSRVPTTESKVSDSEVVSHRGVTAEKSAQCIQQGCTREDSAMCCVHKTTKASDKNTTAEKTKHTIFRVKDGVTVTSDDAVLAGKYFDKKVFLTIGIPSIKRKGRNYLSKTLDSLLYNVSEAKDFSTKIVVLLADIKKSARQKRLEELSSRYSKYLANGNIHVITVPPKVYPPLHGLSKTLHDTEERMFWRSKQAIDFAFLMQYCKSFSPYYLQLEDDVIATRDYDVYMRRYMEEKEGTFWFNLDFSNLGFIGKLYRSETLENQARFFRLFYTEMPVDLLLSAYRTMLGNDVIETTYFRNLFLHIGYESSSLSR